MTGGVTSRHGDRFVRVAPCVVARGLGVAVLSVSLVVSACAEVSPPSPLMTVAGPVGSSTTSSPTGTAAAWQPAVVLAPDPIRPATGVADMTAAARTVWTEDQLGRWIPAESVETVDRTERLGLMNWHGILVSWDFGNVIHVSRDGRTWADARVQPDEGNPSGVVPVGDDLMLLGEGTRVRLGAWRSSDGSDWSGVEGSPLGMRAATPVGTGGLVSVGSVGASAAAWTTPDGLTWSSVPFPQPADGATSELSGVATIGRHVVAIGDVDGTAAVWSSLDLAHWTRSAQPARDDEFLEQVTAAGDLFVIAGRRHERPVVWVSADGLNWTSMLLALPANSTGEVSDVVAKDGRLIAFGWTTEDAGNGGTSRTGYLVWTLDTGR